MKQFFDPVKLKHELKNKAGEIGFVPTMGALHEGHLSLIKASKKENRFTVVSIFVNPTQFNDPNDYKNYPNTHTEDLLKLSALKVDYLFIPTRTLIYNDNYTYQIKENDLSKKLCGASREGHFVGVLTIVMKLFNIVKPAKAYFGEKDFQQYQLIKGMVDAFHMDVKIIALPTIRETDGLAMSSRNLLLTDSERKIAPAFSKLLRSNLSDEKIKSNLENEGFSIDYIETINGRRFGAVYLGNVRLIDNVEK
jgi:pantoate--beta-alanine ligase